jgi:hypothetical protein
LQLYDYGQALWFLYKTGQLSYEYYKTYAVLDQRFAIQNKMDAWNARFQEGKIKFDAWEKENEISRTILAAARTVWLVDEQSKRRTSTSTNQEKSRYRVVQALYDVKYWMKGRIRMVVAYVRNHPNNSWNEFLSGVGIDMKESVGGWDALGTRVGAVIASLIAIHLTGALFAISPAFLALLAVVVGIVWPTWVTELVHRIRELTHEIRARGRGEDGSSSATSLLPSTNTKSSVNTAKLLGRYDKGKYHYFKRLDGTKRYYRTGQSIFAGGGKPLNSKKNDKQKSTTNTNTAALGQRLWPWSRTETKQRTPGKEQWGIFGSSFGNNNNNNNNRK